MEGCCLKFDNEKIVHSRALRDFLISNGAILKKTKMDLKNPNFEIYIFQEDSIGNLLEEYMESRKGNRYGN